MMGRGQQVHRKDRSFKMDNESGGLMGSREAQEAFAKGERSQARWIRLAPWIVSSELEVVRCITWNLKRPFPSIELLRQTV